MWVVTRSKARGWAVREKKGSWATSLLAIALVLSGAGVVTGGVWLSIQMFVNPDAAVWINQVLPEWAKNPSHRESPQTLTQIRASLRQLGQIPGEPLPLETNAHTLQPTSLLLPVLRRRPHCQTGCEQIVELRLYQLSSWYRQELPKSETYYHLVSQLPVEGPEESFAIAPLVDAETANQGSTRPLPLSELGRFEGITPAPGVWLYLMGQRVQAGTAITYGHVVHYNPSRTHLSLMLPWTTTGLVPQWQEVTGGGFPELVVNQTVDLEPQLRVYQVKPLQFILNPIQLEAISLAEPALNDQAYRNALLIARSGLWSPAWKWLQFIKRQHQGRMPAAAQAQIDLIRLYAQLTQSEAEKTWASPSQEVLADLNDGRWGEALQVFQASVENTQEIAVLLKTDSDRLWNRVKAALRVNPERPEVLAWGALILAAQPGRGSAMAWLNQQPKTTPATVAYIQSLLRRLRGEFSTAKISSSHPSRIVGSVEPVTKVNSAQWLQHQKAALKLADQQWYQVQIAAYHDGKRWQREPFSGLTLPKTAQALSLWHQLGLDSDPQIQIVVWLPDGQQQTIIATVKAVQLQNGVLRLLAAASEMAQVKSAGYQPRPLALTEAALQWVQPAPITLAELNQQQPLWVRAILPVLWQELQKSAQTYEQSAIPSFEAMLLELGEWPVQVINLTDNTLAEVVLTVSSEAIAALNNSESGNSQATNNHQSRPRTLIFSDTGARLYSEFSNSLDQSVTAIADLKDGEPPALLVEGSKTYSLQRWSAKHQRFE